MTVNNDDRRQFFSGTGVITSYDFTVKYFNDNEISAYVDAGSDFVIVDPSGYTLTANASGEGGTILFNTAPVSGTRNVLIMGELEYTQETEIPTVDKLARGTLETVADKNTILSQQLKDITGRCLQLPVTTDPTIVDTALPAPEARRALVWNSAGDGIENSENDPDDAADLLSDVEDAAAAAAVSAATATTQASAASASATAAGVSATAAAASATAAHASEVAAASIVSGAGLGTVSNIATAGLATGGPITATGTITVTAASTTEMLAGTNTTKALTPDAAAALWEKGVDTISAGTVTLPEGGVCHITGTTTITAFTDATKTGRPFRTIFDGALQLTHSANLICKGAANITTVAGDSADWVYEGSSVWRMVQYSTQSEAPGSVAVSAASQAEQETATATNKYVTPGRQQYHPSAAKGWCVYHNTATTTIMASHNVSSIVDSGVGDTTVNWNVDFSSANYAFAFGGLEQGAWARSGTVLAGSIEIKNGTTLGGTSADSDYVSVIAFGDQ